MIKISSIFSEYISRFFLLGILFLAAGYFTACSDDPEPDPIAKTPDTDKDPDVDPGTGDPFDINEISDTYHDIAPIRHVYKWGPYNVHDPSILNDGDTYYSYSTDVAFGTDVRPGIQIRKSKDLVKWDFVGWAFDGLPIKGRDFIINNGGQPFNSLWAPYILKVEGEYRLYYSLSSPEPTARLSVIGLATSSSPEGPWTERDLVVTSKNDASIQTNAIDPAVIIDNSGKHWFYYGSAWDGIYVIQLDPETGLAARQGDKGKRIAQRGFTNNKINGNIEGPEVIFNPEFNKFYLFISYDWLETKYNVRVGMSDSPEGPFFDFNGVDMNTDQDNVPMILAPYKFLGHSGWQGTSHPAVFNNGNGQYFLASQGRPGENKFFMVMHVRKMYWTEDGWPVVSPQRYAAVENLPISQEDLVGNWERIVLGYQVIPGYSAEQLSPNFQNSVPLVLDENGTINGDANNQWTYEAPWLELNLNDNVEKVIVDRERDWENQRASTIIFTGLNQEGTAIWGMKK